MILEAERKLRWKLTNSKSLADVVPAPSTRENAIDRELELSQCDWPNNL